MTLVYLPNWRRSQNKIWFGICVFLLWNYCLNIVLFFCKWYWPVFTKSFIKI